MLREGLSKFFKIDNLVANLTGYVETKIELMKIEAKEEIASGASKAIFYGLLAFVAALVIILLSVGAAIALTALWGPMAGFGIIAGMYAVIGIILFVQRDKLMAKLEQDISKGLKKKK